MCGLTKNVGTENGWAGREKTSYKEMIIFNCDAKEVFKTGCVNTSLKNGRTERERLERTAWITCNNINHIGCVCIKPSILYRKNSFAELEHKESFFILSEITEDLHKITQNFTNILTRNQSEELAIDLSIEEVTTYPGVKTQIVSIYQRTKHDMEEKTSHMSTDETQRIQTAAGWKHWKT